MKIKNALTAHAATHTNGTDDIQSATNALKGLATPIQIAELERVGSAVTTDIAAALAGSSGSAPSGTNKFVDKADTCTTNARTPTAHAATHTNGTDDIQSATNALKGLATPIQIAELERVGSAVTTDIAAALAGTSGTAPSGTNKLVDNADTRLKALPIGAIIEFGSSTPPTDFLECDGSAISRTTYASLYAVIGTTHGSGNGSTTFNIPERRGEFPCGWDHGRGIDSGRAFASYQAQATALDGCWISSGGYSASGPGTSTFKVGTGTITRPRNVAVMYIIKY